MKRRGTEMKTEKRGGRKEEGRTISILKHTGSKFSRADERHQPKFRKEH